jgi:hypothetical protein
MDDSDRCDGRARTEHMLVGVVNEFSVLVPPSCRNLLLCFLSHSVENMYGVGAYYILISRLSNSSHPFENGESFPFKTANDACFGRKCPTFRFQTETEWTHVPPTYGLRSTP